MSRSSAIAHFEIGSAKRTEFALDQLFFNLEMLARQFQPLPRTSRSTLRGRECAPMPRRLPSFARSSENASLAPVTMLYREWGRIWGIGFRPEPDTSPGAPIATDSRTW